MSSYIIKGANIVNEGKQFSADVLIRDSRIEKIGHHLNAGAAIEIRAEGMLLLPGAIDDQVHFREPGLSHKGDLYTESRAAVAGGVTSFMEMPNTVPNVFTQELLEEKFALASQRSLANYSFFMGASNDNLAEVLKTDPANVCGVKIFMGSSTGNMLVDDPAALEGIFSQSPLLIATHCEDEQTIRTNIEKFKAEYGDSITPSMHPLIRTAEACYKSSSMAVQLAKKHGTRLHILHISTAKETSLFSNDIPLKDKKITAEACVHHLWFSDKDYELLGNNIKWNPAIKRSEDRDEVRKAVKDGRIDVVATDHAPHTIDEKSQPYLQAPSGGPLVQHSIVAMLELVKQGIFTLEEVVQKMCHNPAILFRIKERGFIREGYFADPVLINPEREWTVDKSNILYKCGWSPFEGHTFQAQVQFTFVNGYLAYQKGFLHDEQHGKRLQFSY